MNALFLAIPVAIVCTVVAGLLGAGWLGCLAVYSLSGMLAVMLVAIRKVVVHAQHTRPLGPDATEPPKHGAVTQIGSGLVLDHSQNKTVAASLIAEKNVSGR